MKVGNIGDVRFAKRYADWRGVKLDNGEVIAADHWWTPKSKRPVYWVIEKLSYGGWKDEGQARWDWFAVCRISSKEMANMDSLAKAKLLQYYRKPPTPPQGKHAVAYGVKPKPWIKEPTAAELDWVEGKTDTLE